MKPGKIFTLENDRSDPLSQEKHRRRRAPGAPTNNKYFSFHHDLYPPPAIASRGGEETYIFENILKGGHRLVYESQAYVRHRQRRAISALRRQIYNYSKGHVSYHLTTLIDDHDLRAAGRMLIGLPRAHAWRVARRLLGRSEYPIWLVLVEIAGNFAGPWGLLRSRMRVLREGHSEPYASESTYLAITEWLPVEVSREAEVKV